LRRLINCDDRRREGDRRLNAFRRWRRVVLGGLPVVAIDQATTAKVMVAEALKRRGQWRFPAFLTSTNGEVTHICAVSDELRAMFLQADAIHADGMSHVFASRLKCQVALPERVATTDLFYVVSAEAARQGATMYMLGATEEVNAAAAKNILARFPSLKLVGRRNGFFKNLEDELAACEEIAALAPDILWVSMGVPIEQSFVVRNRNQLTSVGVIKTSGGLFDFVAGVKPRAPVWMQKAGLEWLWRVRLEPKRLGLRYLKTNPLALYLLLTRSG
jgi:N-acetylglucosaminyldiphosphoundecaprenol N-acetyl-beta-D-mannosaminyltransferase